MRKQLKHRWQLALGALLVVLLLATAARAASSGASVDWWVIAGGGGQGGAATSLGGTLGQAVAGGDTRLCAGFWCGVPAQVRVWLPLVLRGA